jgi:hypothetical protein
MTKVYDKRSAAHPKPYRQNEPLRGPMASYDHDTGRAHSSLAAYNRPGDRPIGTEHTAARCNPQIPRGADVMNKHQMPTPVSKRPVG